MSFMKTLEQFADWREKFRPSITIATLSVCPETARRKLRIRKGEPLEYRGLKLRCVGSKLWRERRAAMARYQERVSHQTAGK